MILRINTSQEVNKKMRIRRCKNQLLYQSIKH